MKKLEAQALAVEKSKLIIEYIIQILSDSEKIKSDMIFCNTKINNQPMCTLDIYVPDRKFEKHLNLEITADHSLVLYEQILNSLLDNFLESENIGITKYYSIKSIGQKNFSGVDVVNLNGSRVKLNFNTTHPDFMNLVSQYTEKCHEYEELLNSQRKNQLYGDNKKNNRKR